MKSKASENLGILSSILIDPFKNELIFVSLPKDRVLRRIDWYDVVYPSAFHFRIKRRLSKVMVEMKFCKQSMFV